jgi:GTP-binding protein
MKMKEPLHGARFLMAETAHERLPASQGEVAVLGRSNVGKSSLLCALTNNWKLARVSKTPGATRGIHIYEVRPEKWLVDLPGYGYAVGAPREKNYWMEMISRYVTERPSLKRVYVLVDAQVGVSTSDAELVGWLIQNKVPFRLVGTKTDKIGRQHHAAQRAKMADALGTYPEEVFWVTAKEGYGLPALEKDIVLMLAL